MKVEVLNNWKKKRQFSNFLWIKKGIMFPYRSNYLQFGLFGFIFTIHF